MLLPILNIVFVFIAIAMIALILMQRGSGAAAGSGFGGGASATVFGARGASNFLSKATKWLAISFFVVTLYMAYLATEAASPGPAQQDLGVMSQVPAAPPPSTTVVPTAPAAPASAVPAAPTQPDAAISVPAQGETDPPPPAPPTR